MKILLAILSLSVIAAPIFYQLPKDRKRSHYEARGNKYMISSQGEYTTAAAKYALDRGGNLYDAFVAASFVISVERPHSTGIGGGGFLLSHDAKKRSTYTYDFRESAPGLAHSKIFLDKNNKQIHEASRTGVLAVATPGLIKGLWEIHQKKGKLPWNLLVEPAIRLANKGFAVYPGLYKATNHYKTLFCKDKFMKDLFLDKDCEPKKVGEILVQKDLGTSLRMIAEHGAKTFYSGYIADRLEKLMIDKKGLIRKDDLLKYEVKDRKPVVGNFNGHKIVSMGPPSSGGTHIIQILNILDHFDLKKYGAHSTEALHLTASAMQIAFADRAAYMGDADFADIPVEDLLNRKYSKKLSRKISLSKLAGPKSFPIPFRKLIYESDETTHFTIMDSEGNVISSTQTINGWFGAKITIPGTGIILNNEMDDFASHVGGVNLFGAVGGKNNLVEPYKRPLSSMSPSLVFDKNNKPMLALGTPSGTRILTCVMQTILNVLEFDMNLWDAVSALRIHQQWSPHKLRVGPPFLSKAQEKALEEKGHVIDRKGLGCKIQAIMKKDNQLIGVSDPREEGRSFGI